MSREFSRTDRVADALQKELAIIIRNEVRDPRIGMVSVNAVEVSRDLSYAKVYVTFVDNPKNCEPSERVAVLNKVSGFLRTALGREVQMRIIPQIKFVLTKPSIRRKRFPISLRKRSSLTRKSAKVPTKTPRKVFHWRVESRGGRSMLSSY